MDTEHTPGPWQVSHTTDCTGYPLYAIHGFGGEEKRDKELHDANARLIAAAPDLLGVLKEVIWNNMLVEGSEWWGRVYAAIAKAEGRTP